MMENKDLVKMIKEKDPKVVAEIKIKILDKMNESKHQHKIGSEVYIAQKDGKGFKAIKAKVTGFITKTKQYELEIDNKDAGTFNFDQVYKDKMLDEAKFEVTDVMGHEYYIVTDDKEMFSDSGEIRKLPKPHDLWLNKAKTYKDFLMSKKDAEDFAKELNDNKIKVIKVTTEKKV